MLFNRDIEKRFPSVAYMEKEAQRRIPRFARDYLTDGLGVGLSVNRNEQALQDVVLMPRYIADVDEPDLSCQILGFNYDAPFGVAPMGASGVVWPRSELILAKAAKKHNIPYGLSTVANVGIEQIGAITGDNGWFQLYTPKPLDILESLLERCKNSGFKTMMVTVDVPVRTRREHLIRSGWSVPPRFDLTTLLQMIACPGWALRMLRSGVPQFVNLRPYADPNMNTGILDSIMGTIRLTTGQLGGRITAERFRVIRDLWDGKLLVKGILDPDDAKSYLKLGADGVIVSNHGGRQLDAAPTVTYALPKIREVVGASVPLIADGGVRSGLDIARLLALGADFVLLGRPFLYAVAALDELGGDHVMNILKMELQQAMGQLGCHALDELSDRLVKSNSGMWAVQDILRTSQTR